MNTTDKDREEAMEELAVGIVALCAKDGPTTEQMGEIKEMIRDYDARIRAEAKPEALREAAYRADDELAEIGFNRDEGNVRSRVESAILAEELQTPEQAQTAADDRAYAWRHDMMGDESQPSCTWVFDASTDSWDSACGEKWSFTADGPRENGVRYCHGCGKPVRDALAALGRIAGKEE